MSGPLDSAHAVTKLPAQDLDRARAFYRDRLGLEPVEERDGGLRYLCGATEFHSSCRRGRPRALDAARLRGGGHRRGRRRAALPRSRVRAVRHRRLRRQGRRRAPCPTTTRARERASAARSSATAKATCWRSGRRPADPAPSRAPARARRWRRPPRPDRRPGSTSWLRARRPGWRAGTPTRVVARRRAGRSRTPRPRPAGPAGRTAGSTSAASMSSWGRKPAMAATRSSATRGSRRAGPKNDSVRSWSSSLAATVATSLRLAVDARSCNRISARASRGSVRHSAAAFLSASGGNLS